MKKDVIVSITGLGMDEDEKAIEVSSGGLYYQKDGRDHILYTEYMDPDSRDGGTRSRITLEGERILLHRTGDVVGQMIFEKGHSHTVYYETPLGTMELKMLTHRIRIQREETALSIDLEYELAVNEQPRGINKVSIRVREAESEETE